MNKTTTISLLSVLAFVLGFLTFYFHFQNPVSNQIQEKPTASVQQKWDTKTDEQANVTVVVTPLDLSPQSAEWKFDVGMNTHAVELGQDMTKIVVLIDNQGKEYKPLAWAGPTGGHHREGTLTFARITPTPKSVELKITGIADVVMTFVWQL